MKNRSGKTQLKFKTTNDEKAARKRFFLILFICLVVLLAAVSGLLLWKEYGGKTTQADPYQNTTNMKKETHVLFGGVNTDDTLAWLTVISANTTNGTFTVQAVPVGDSYEGDSYNTIYGGDNAGPETEASLMEAVQANENISIDRYAFVAKGNIGEFVSDLGGFSMTVDKTIDYSGDDFSLHLMKGKQSLSGTNFFNYLQYAGLDADEAAMKKQAAIMAAFVKTVINSTNAAAGQTLFSTVIDLTESDISINDFVRYSDFLTSVSENDINITVVS